jgi:hypothetical protein
MKIGKSLRSALTAGLLTLAMLVASDVSIPQAFASGGSGGGGGTTSNVDTLKVNKCYYFDTGGYVELLLQAVSSNSSAHIYAYLPDGTYLGEVQNGGGGRYGGTVFGSYHVPASITFISSSGGSLTVATSPMQL